MLLYSRLTGLKTLFTLRRTSHFLSSDFHPYTVQIRSNDGLPSTRCTTVVLQVVRKNAVGHPAGNERDSPYQENEIHLLRCIVLNSDLTLIESYIISCFPKPLPRTLQAPRSLRRPRPPRSSYRVPDHFIIPNGLLNEDAQERTTQPASSTTRGYTNSSDVKHRDLSQPKDQWTINLEWLSKHISSPVAYSLEERLQFVRSRLDVDNNLPGQKLVSLYVDPNIRDFSLLLIWY